MGPLTMQGMGLTPGPASWAGAGLKAAGSILAGIEQSRSLKASAKAKEIEAAETRRRGQWEQMRINEQMRRTLSTQRQLYGQAGVRMEGTPTETMSRTKAEAVLDRMVHAQNVHSEVLGLLADAKELRRAARAAKRQGVVNAFSSFF